MIKAFCETVRANFSKRSINKIMMTILSYRNVISLLGLDNSFFRFHFAEESPKLVQEKKLRARALF